MNEDLELYQFDSADNPNAEEWVRATLLGFHQPDHGDTVVARAVRRIDGPRFVATGIRNRNPQPDEGAVEKPVATFARFIAQANLGAGEVDAGMLTEATVRPTHKRRGILREMMQLNLTQLAEQGVPLALLMASDARIYERFGFSRTIDTYRIQVDPKGLEMREAVKATLQGYTIEWIDREAIICTAQEIYERVHATTRGSVTRRPGHLEDFLFSDTEDELERKYRCFVAVSPEGVSEGFVIYEVKEEPAGFTLRIADMAYASSRVELVLWQHMLDMEMINEIIYSDMTADGLGGGSALFRAVTNTRAVRITGWADFLWAKVLDPVACLEARSYTYAAKEAGLSVAFRVKDPDGYADGKYRLVLDETGATVESVDEESAVSMTANALAVLVYGAALPSELAVIGHIAGASEEDLQVWDSLFAAVGPARITSHF